MKISILTPDSKIPNLAAMKISAWHKQQGDNVELNFPLIKADFTYASKIFKWTPEPIADLIGGPYDPCTKLDPQIDAMKPDYSIYTNIDYSMGYTYKACPRTCDFCIVPEQHNDEKHYSIWTFHDKKFKKISLLNNNTFADPSWRDTFQEIYCENLTVIDHNGYDARLILEDHAQWLKRLKFEGQIHTAWDYMEHGNEVVRGLKYLKEAKVNPVSVYILIGHTTHEEDMYRVMEVENMGFDAFVMPLDKHNFYQRSFARWVNHKATFKSCKWEYYHG
jgi:hypothetical protein